MSAPQFDSSHYSFSGYTKGLFEVINLSSKDDDFEITISIPAKYKKIKTKQEKFPETLSLNGIKSKPKFSTQEATADKIVCLVKKSDFYASSLSYKGSKVSLSYASKNKAKYLLTGTPKETTVTYLFGTNIPDTSNQELYFECTESQFSVIKKNQRAKRSGETIHRFRWIEFLFTDTKSRKK